ncbi:PE-PPE domain-containing protein [Mycobacterium sp. SMC-8]|uniref:PE-PPE domain-containing protein n=2 Tax=unclassified Mycobacterium TaxID=2642494 RepID=UPI0021B2915E|nr:PE-PPE domain-containing protein [Mycobacterium sp. SMC-8]UXA10712.1 PE-PPE domain-containing protein [Mycobacterium sp. SMC-8]
MKRLVTFIGIIGVAFAPAVANGATALLVGGKGGYAELTDEQMSTAFGGFFGEYTRVSVPFPGTDDFVYSVEMGTQSLYTAVVDTLRDKPDELITIGGVSEGAPAVDRVVRMLMALEPDQRPDPTRFNVMIYGAPNPLMMTVGGIPYQPLPETPYHVMVVMAEYDGVSDWPDNPFNLLAVLNAVMGGVDLHVKAAWTDIFTVPTKYYIDANDACGSLTTVLIQTPLLPLLRPMLDWGFDPRFVDFMDDLLRPIIDSAYNRPKWTVGIPPNLDDLQLSTRAAEELTGSTVTPQLTMSQPGPEESGASQRSLGPAPAGETTGQTGPVAQTGDVNNDSQKLIERSAGSVPTVVFEPEVQPGTQAHTPEQNPSQDGTKPTEDNELPGGEIEAEPGDDSGGNDGDNDAGANDVGGNDTGNDGGDNSGNGGGSGDDGNNSGNDGGNGDNNTGNDGGADG